MYSPRVSIPSREGTFERILSSEALSNQLGEQHGANKEGVVLLIVAWTALLGDSPIKDMKPNRVINRFINRLSNDLMGVVSSYSQLAHSITLSLRREQGVIIIDPFLKEMQKTPIFPEYLHFLKTRDGSVLRFILSFLNFGKKLYYEDDQLESIAFHKWVQVEERLSGLDLPPLVENLRDVMRWIFKEWDYDYFLPKHGGGAVAERGVRGVNLKNSQFAISRKIDYLYFRDSIMRGIDSDMPCSPDGEKPSNMTSSSTSRLMFVPKDWKSKRSICMEPIGYQWAQQGVRLWIERHISSCVLHNHVNIQKQELNQQASEFGSKTGLVDTIDLSSASDSVSWSLVKTIFPAGVLKHLLATRTKIVELPDRKRLEVFKYAPMGSALCFPIQSTIYSAIVMMVSIAATYGLDWRKAGCFRGIDLDLGYKHTFKSDLSTRGSLFQPFRCYGDDIACDTRATSNVIEALTLLGFVVNKEKSYTGDSAFRESCGLYHFDGQDVSPYFYKVKKVSQRMSIDTLAGVIDHANRALSFGYTQLRKHLIQICQFYPIQGVRAGKRQRMNPILFTEDDEESFAILCTKARNDHLRQRTYSEKSEHIGLREVNCEETNVRYQRDEVLSLVPGPQKRKKIPQVFDNYNYILWWRSRYRGDGSYENDPMGHLDIPDAPAKTDTLGVGVRWRWTASGA